MTSSVIESYMFGFENAFGYHDEVVVEARPDQIRLDEQDSETLLSSLLLIEVKNPLNLDQNVAVVELKFKLELDIEISDSEDRVIARVDNFEAELASFSAFYDCHTSENVMQA